MELTHDCYFGIDGGGTKTEAILCDASGKILGRFGCGATNANDVGTDTALVRLCGLIREAHKCLGENGNHLSVFCGLAGALNHRENLLPVLRSSFPKDTIEVNSDAFNLLATELYDGSGCCLIFGTGSVCFVRRGDEIQRIGGWGYLLDRTGSGYAMGREALEASLRARDGRGEGTLLTGSIMKKLGAAPWDKLTEIYEGGKAFIASFAPCVLECAEEGDRIAFEILYRQAVYLAEMLDAAYHWRGEWGTPLEVVLGGGIFKAKSDLMSLIEQNVTVPVRLQIASAPQVFGAVWEAVRMVSETVTQNDFTTFKDMFLSGYLREEK
jgi:N-acetylglucosamine kinase-like BadF-type ATPase